ncbi:MAG: lipopolysaccharide biosynthesis protein [Bacteroidales bacterium]|nr:lipopolysaccharide biosynthesis protein [Bacteroidales bacterium]
MVRPNSKVKYYVHGFLMRIRPAFLSRLEARRLRKYYQNLPPEEKSLVDDRVDYYCRLADAEPLPAETPTIGDFKYFHPSAYYYDTYEYIRLFPKNFRMRMVPGDVVDLQPFPSIVKSRPIASDASNRNSVILKLDKARHFLFLNDPYSYEQKQPRVLFRGFVDPRPNRRLFMQMYENHPLVDAKNVKPHEHEAHDPNKLSLKQQLQYRYIMALEGKDVASNLKWIMSSNSLAVMPKPTYEIWFMEGRLKPNYHYVEVKPDFSDLPERIAYYEAHPDEAKQIIAHAHEYIQQFLDPKKEDLISFLVLDKYFEKTKK